MLAFRGSFRSERPTHLVVLGGHEFERMIEIIEFLEPSRLTISGGHEDASAGVQAGRLSREVVRGVRERIQVPLIHDFEFSSFSVRGVFESLVNSGLESRDENVALVAMNTKLSFVGASLFSLVERSVRMMYAVPREYNPEYCRGVGESSVLDVTEFIRRAKTDLVA